MVEIGVEVIQEDRVHEDAEHLRERRAGEPRFAFPGNQHGPRLLAREGIRGAARAHAQGEQVRRAEPDRGAERRHQPEAAVAEPELARLGGHAHRREDRRDRGRREHVSVVERHPQHHPAALDPDRMAGAPLDEGERAARVVAGGGDRHRVEPTAADRVGDPARREDPLDQLREGRGVEERAGSRVPEQPAEREVARQREAGARERARVGPEYLLDAQLRPDARDLARRVAEPRAARREQRSVDRARRGARHDRERGRAVPQRRDLAEALEHARLIGAARAAGGEDESEHRSLDRSKRGASRGTSRRVRPQAFVPGSAHPGNGGCSFRRQRRQLDDLRSPAARCARGWRRACVSHRRRTRASRGSVHPGRRRAGGRSRRPTAARGESG